MQRIYYNIELADGTTQQRNDHRVPAGYTDMQVLNSLDVFYQNTPEFSAELKPIRFFDIRRHTDFTNEDHLVSLADPRIVVSSSGGRPIEAAV